MAGRNILIAPRERDGINLLDVFAADRGDWIVIGYGGPLLAHKAKILVIVRADLACYVGREREQIESWFAEYVPHMIQRAERVVEI